jgi:hypothetical protein
MDIADCKSSVAGDLSVYAGVGKTKSIDITQEIPNKSSVFHYGVCLVPFSVAFEASAVYPAIALWRHSRTETGLCKTLFKPGVSKFVDRFEHRTEYGLCTRSVLLLDFLPFGKLSAMFVTFILLLQSHLMGIEFLNSHRALDLV